jgi:hypothetical protein
MTVSRSRGDYRALGGVLFAAFFIASLVLAGALSSGSLPLPDAPASEAARYYDENRTAAIVSGSLQGLSAASLLAFVPSVAAFARRTVPGRGAMARIVLWGGVLAGVLLLISVLFGFVVGLAAAGGNLALVGTFRDLNFLFGGALHVASLAPFVGGASLVALRTKAMQRWIPPFGLFAAAIALLCLVSLFWYPASVLDPIGRLLAFVWSVAVGVALSRGGRARTDARADGETAS